jgi:hypothetical protein
MKTARGRIQLFMAAAATVQFCAGHSAAEHLLLRRPIAADGVATVQMKTVSIQKQ